jgi:hypothetical protein
MASAAGLEATPPLVVRRWSGVVVGVRAGAQPRGDPADHVADVVDVVATVNIAPSVDRLRGRSLTS